MTLRQMLLTLYICWRTCSRLLIPELTVELREIGPKDRITERACFQTLTYLTIVEGVSEDHQSTEEDSMEICNSLMQVGISQQSRSHRFATRIIINNH